MIRPRQLSATFVKTVKDAGAYGDGRGGHGLTLLVKMGAGRVLKSWYQRIRIDGQPVNIGLGAYPVVTLSDARAKALANARLVARGQDPRQGVTSVPTLREAADKVIALHAANWKDGGKSAAQWQASLDAYAMPRLGSRPVDRITTVDVMAVVMPIWNEKRETARRVRQRLNAVMKWAVAQGYRDDNPAGDAIGAALPKNSSKREHQRALAHGNVAGALRAIRETNAWASTKLALEFVALTACRSGEVRGAKWCEVDLECATWTVPPERMKAGKEHRVPLSDRALGVLAEARELSDGAGLVFPSATGKQLTDNTLSKLLRENNIDAVPHGFRSSFRDWCGDSGVAREVAEACLAHVVKSQVEAAYARSDLLERRREVMQNWADYVTKTAQGCPIVSRIV